MLTPHSQAAAPSLRPQHNACPKALGTAALIQRSPGSAIGPPEPAGASQKETKQHFGEKNLIAALSRAWVGAAGPGASEELAGSWQAAHGVIQPQPPPTNHNKTMQYVGLWVPTPRSCLASFYFHSDVCVEQQRSETQHGQEAGTQPSDPSPPVPGAAAPIWSRYLKGPPLTSENSADTEQREQGVKQGAAAGAGSRGSSSQVTAPFCAGGWLGRQHHTSQPLSRHARRGEDLPDPATE